MTEYSEKPTALKRRAFGHPLLHFLLFALLLHGLALLKPPATEPISLSESDIRLIRQQWFQETGKQPDSGELKASIVNFADRERLIREALRMQLDRTDPVIRDRIRLNLKLLYPEKSLNDKESWQLTNSLGMLHSDLIIRRRLELLMRTRLAQSGTNAGVPHGEPSGGHDSPGATRYVFEQRWFDPERQVSDAASERAENAIASLRSDANATVRSDPFLLGERLGPITIDQIRHQLGPDVADAVRKANRGQWIGPVSSPYGLHLVRVLSVDDNDQKHIANRLGVAYQQEHTRDRQAIRVGLKKLRARYPIELPESAETLLK